MQSKEAVGSLVDELLLESERMRTAMAEAKELTGIDILRLAGLLLRASIALDTADRNARSG